ncbi:transcriptional regulator [Vibrio sp. 10N.286.49.C2]|uniref:helix-turn-helix domain-containing protein n=1 Tax=unclassified Vibrio TaxID=2614977 RepID=UPI000C8649FE|nr:MULTISPECIES: helix-turn-helix transcriptional regulator [unclassified Vibrio]PMH30920.1 transcriptional regulator [Vibrio sp. 10N.286.49.C2]PMH48142.1 transcriptional regulator [Vibrio sp. 10N.286.49.B1]PMH80708.1 transcriptional regulator [Vibrio sp. 10N.286.48.B7]
MKSLEEIATLLTEQRRKLGIEQKDMYMRIGMKQQQYQRIEAGSDVKLSTLLRVLEGLDLELSISPKQSKGHNALTEDTFKSLNQVPKSDPLQDDEDDLGFWFGSEDK